MAVRADYGLSTAGGLGGDFNLLSGITYDSIEILTTWLLTSPASRLIMIPAQMTDIKFSSESSRPARSIFLANLPLIICIGCPPGSLAAEDRFVSIGQSSNFGAGATEALAFARLSGAKGNPSFLLWR